MTQRNQTTTTGFFISFEGIEGCGKTTQVQLLYTWLQSRGVNAIVTREPGGTEIGEQIRMILMRTSNSGMSHVTEAMLLAASRAQLVKELIRPVLATGAIVITDRYADASLAYQGYGRGMPLAMVKHLIGYATEDLTPDATFLINIEPEQSLRRARQRDLTMNLSGSQDRFEQEELEFHIRVREGYLQLASQQRQRFIVINGMRPVPQIHEEIRTLLVQRFPSLEPA